MRTAYADLQRTSGRAHLESRGFLPDGITFVSPILRDLRLQGLPASAVQSGLLGIPESLVGGRELLQEHDVVSPRNF